MYFAKREHDVSAKAYVLDFGCGKGWWLEEHGGHGVIGMDVSPAYLKIARQRAVEGTSFVIADGHHLPFKNKSFHTVHVSGVLHHMDDLKVGVNEINRVLDGFLDLREIVDDEPLHRIGRRIVKGHRGMSIGSLFKSRELEDKIREHFKIDNIEYYSYTPLGTAFWYLFIEPTENRMLLKIVLLLEQPYQALFKKLGRPRILASQIEIVAYNNIVPEKAVNESDVKSYEILRKEMR